jgi:poly(3-hydroxybutyrate) depolymerase
VRRLAISTALAVAASVVLLPFGASAADTNQLPPGDQQFTIDFGGGAREYLVRVPTGTQPGKRLPVVFNFHGGGSDAPTQKAYSQMDATADRHGFDVNGTPRGAVLGESTKIVDASELMWEFFAKHPLPKS